MKRHFLTLWDVTEEEIWALIERAQVLKKACREGSPIQTLRGKVLGLLFLKPSTRTRVSFEAGMYRLGGQCIFMTSRETQLARKEPLSDTARVLSRYIDALVVRTYGHHEVEELARYSTIPVINGLTDLYHPCQVLSDIMTVWEKKGSFDFPIAWVGDGNNVAHSWIVASARLGLTLRVATPKGYEPDKSIVERALREGKGRIELLNDPVKAVEGAQVVNTDVWASMGQEDEAEARREVFRPYQVNEGLLKHAHPEAIVMHCLPAHRGEEITDEVMERYGSVIFDQAENRMFAQMALLEWLLIGS
ncbi:ornithine carbamoyltransferase [Thermodesulforhabdus norvegica]|uniref:Ornithine carbamoyltransferase n=1 Tax=Thermodesulforhabdus norvegica TaxID=39841 RepID=A0A1I4W5P8_9BACT|nr:ornithine carbamoyltransferase [Thermodesulforhabdus norvegica]SFN08697.1 ornithine carbamoyltransferase [Thermodesulforhabdus norvegica]